MLHILAQDDDLSTDSTGYKPITYHQSSQPGYSFLVEPNFLLGTLTDKASGCKYPRSFSVLGPSYQITNIRINHVGGVLCHICIWVFTTIADYAGLRGPRNLVR